MTTAKPGTAAAFEKFGRMVFDSFTDSLVEGDYCVAWEDMLGAALRTGLVTEITYDPEKHRDLFKNPGEIEPGEKLYICKGLYMCEMDL